MPQKAPKPVPDGMHTITVHLWFNGNCNQAVEFYQKAFGAKLAAPPVPTPDGKGIMHAMLKLGDSNIMMADTWPGNWEQGPKQGSSASMWLYVEDCDALYNQAVKAGCEVVEEMMDAFWGDRNGKVKDPFGHCWSIASHKWVLTPEEMQERMDEWLKSINR
jgi:PhnB protein